MEQKGRTLRQMVTALIIAFLQAKMRCQDEMPRRAIHVLWIILRRPKSDGRVSNQVVMMAGVPIGQIGLGILNVLLLVPMWLQLVHLLVAELFWVLMVLASATAHCFC